MTFRSLLLYLALGSFGLVSDTFAQTLLSQWHLIDYSGSSCLAFSPNQQFLASGGGFGVTIWDLQSGRIYRSLKSHQGSACSLAFSPDGKTLASGGQRGSEPGDRSLKLTLWDVQSGTAKTSVADFRHEIYLTGFSPDGKLVATASNTVIENTFSSEVRVYDTSTMKVLNRFTTKQRELAWFALQALTKGKWDGSALPSNYGRLYSQETHQLLSQLLADAPTIMHVKQSNQDHYAVALRRPAAVVYDLSNANSSPVLSVKLPNSDLILSAALSPDDTLLAVGGTHMELDERNDRYITTDLYVALWNLKTGTRERTLSAHINAILDLAFSTDGASMATSSFDRKIVIWDIESLTQRVTVIGHADTAFDRVAFSPDNSSVAIAGFDSTIKLLEVSSGKEIQNLRGRVRPVSSLTFSADGQYLACGGFPSTIQVWDLRKKQPIKLFQSGAGTITWLSFSPDGRSLFSRDFQGTVKIWDVSSNRAARILAQNTEAVALSHDGKTLAVGGPDPTIRLLSTTDPAILSTLAGHTGRILALAFSPDDQTLASGALDESARIWDLKTGQLVAALPRTSEKYILPKYFSRNGKRLYALEGSAFQTWDLSSPASASPAGLR